MEAIEKLPWEDVVKDRGASYPSIRDIFLHVLDAYRYWFEYATKGSKVKEYADIDPANVRNVADLRKLEREVNSMVMGIVNGLREEDLQNVFKIDQSAGDGGAIFSRSMEMILIHMIEEELQHRGELNCLFWQQDVEPPITSYGEWLTKKWLRQ